MRFVLALLLAAGYAQAGPDASEVRVRHDAGQFVDSGSGTVVWSEKGISRVLTACHVVPDDRWIKVEHAGKSYPARRLAWDPALDLACVEVDATLPVAPVAKAGPAIGQTLDQWGHPKASVPAVHKTGAVVGFVRMSGYDRLMTTTPVQGGDSGCGVFDGDGRLVGVCIALAGFPGGQHEQCVALADVRKFLRLDE